MQSDGGESVLEQKRFIRGRLRFVNKGTVGRPRKVCSELNVMIEKPVVTPVSVEEARSRPSIEE